MADTLTCRATSADGRLFEGSVKSVRAPAHNGEVTILPGHIAFVAALRPGKVVLEGAGTQQAPGSPGEGGGTGARSFDIAGGLLEVLHNQVLIVLAGPSAARS
ncbi:MAG: hypothetical protein HYY13_02025 [Nitrospirae bacterium]|nr:hypothetical protein [Nitrospirota bacterium]